jgi:hypothetical protein
VGRFDDYAYAFIESALRQISPVQASDAYVVSLFVYDEGDDPRRPTAMVGCNTRAQAASETKNAFDEDEARWNYAFWLQNDLGVLCGSYSDPEGVSARDDWIRDENLIVDEERSDVTAAFVRVLEGVVSRLHSAGVVEELFGQPIPVLIHELEYYDEIAEQNQRANPPGLADAFAEWARGGQ